MIHSISPIDGRYREKTLELTEYWSEAALIKYRILVEIKYLLALSKLNIPPLVVQEPTFSETLATWLDNITEKDVIQVKEIEKRTRHDVKAVEYYIKDFLKHHYLESISEWVHFGLTSQDINHTALPLMLRDSIRTVYLPNVTYVIESLSNLATPLMDYPLLSRTHGQPASPSTMGKELMVFVYRLNNQIQTLEKQQYTAKFSGATGNFNAHYVAFPNIDWSFFADTFIKSLGLERQKYTTQISNYDTEAELFHNLVRIHTVLLDLCRDIWTYISLNYFSQNLVDGEVGSSTMPHKVNPIDFENAEGNLGLANSLLSFMSEKLPVSRLQRDLTDSTVSRNIGVAMAHALIAFKSIVAGLQKLQIHAHNLHEDLNSNWAVITEGIQTILRREGYPSPYEALKELSRGKGILGMEEIHSFIDGLDVNESIKKELKLITPHNYLGDAGRAFPTI